MQQQVCSETIQNAVEALEVESYLSVDTETTGLEEYDRPFSFSIASGSGAYNFDSRVIPGVWEHPGVRELCARTSICWIMQNPKFDMRMLGYMGLECAGRIVDLTVAARLSRNDYVTYRLADQAKRNGMAKQDAVMKYIKDHDLYTERRDPLGETYKQPRFDLVPIDLIGEYACHDARITYDLYMHKYAGDIIHDQQRVLENEMQLTKTCFKMERHGVLLDREYTIQARRYSAEEAESRKNFYLGLTGVEYVNSARSIGPHLDGYVLPTTEDGNPSLTDDVLDMILVDGSPKAKNVAETVRLIRKATKRVSTYYDPYLNKAGPDNIIHPSMWPGGTRTGRLSYSDPNLQNLHKDKGSTEPYVVRGCFIPRPGNVLLSFDFEQMEYKAMAAYANDKRIIKAVSEGADFHQATADLLGIDRDRAKTLNFAILYGAGDEKIAMMLGCAKDEARTLRLKYFMAMPLVEDLINKIQRTGKSRGYVTTWLGRRLHARWDFCYALPNHLIQGGCADVVKVAMNRVAAKYPHVPMVMQIHDELVFDVPESLVDDTLVRGIKAEMEGAWPTKNGMRLTVGAEISTKSFAKRDFTPWQ